MSQPPAKKNTGVAPHVANAIRAAAQPKAGALDPQRKAAHVPNREIRQAPSALQPKAAHHSQHGVIQPIIDFPSGARGITEDDLASKRTMFTNTLRNMREQSKPAHLIRALEQALTNLPVIPENQVAFQSIMPEQNPVQPWLLSCRAPGHAYMVLKQDDVDIVANGQYRFVIPADGGSSILVTQDPFGHQSIAGERPVLYAGTAYFSQGNLLYWNNDTGHYRTPPNVRLQATLPRMADGRNALLPLNKFRRFA